MSGLATNGLPVVLVASASSNTADTVARELSASGKVNVRAMYRNPDGDNAKALSKLPNVTVIKGDFADNASIKAALSGASRALLVSGGFDFSQFDYETSFIQAAVDANLQAVVRVGTASMLTDPASPQAYGRAHFGIETFAKRHNYPVISLNPNWFFDNVIANAEEAKATGKISMPAAGNGKKGAFVDPRDVGRAGAHILLSSDEKLKDYIEARQIEVHGPGLLNFDDNMEALSKAVGYEIKVNEVPLEGWVATMIGYGIPKEFARSFGLTFKVCGGVLEPVAAGVEETSKVLLEDGWKPKYDVKAWADSPKVQAAFKK